MLDFSTIFLLIIFSSVTITFKLSELSDNLNESGHADTDNEEVKYEDDVTSLHENYRGKHKYKVGTGHQGVTKRLVDDTSAVQREQIQNPQCAVLYQNNVPVGILQPFEDSYRFLPVRGEPTLVDIQPIPLKTKTDPYNPIGLITDHLEYKRSNSPVYSEESYPLIFTKFKINSRLDKTRVKDFYKKKSMFKRQDNTTLDEQLQEVNSTLDSLKVDNKRSVEENLQSLLNDMGLMNDYYNEDIKRDIDVQMEDENLELVTNKLDLVKEEKTNLRNKRYNEISSNSTFNETHNSTLNETVRLNRSQNLNFNDTNKKKFNKRSDGNIKESDCTSIHSEGSLEVNEYERRVEREIRDKIKKIKEEVTSEIDNISNNDNDVRRKKRQVTNTLLDGETKGIDPNYNVEENSKIYVRRKRNIQAENVEGFTHNVTNHTGFYKRKALKSIEKDNKIFKTKSRRKKRNIETYVVDPSEYQEFNENKIFEKDGDNNPSVTFNKRKNDDGCNCNENDKYCECSNNNPQSKRNTDNFGMKFENKKSLNQLCSCDKNGSYCKCANIDKNGIHTKFTTKGPLLCSCDKTGNNCKCTHQVSDAIPSIQKGYSEYNEYNEHFNEYSNEDDPQNLHPFIEEKENDYVGDDEFINYNDLKKFQKRSVKARKYADSKSLQNGEYFVDLEPGVYKLEPMDNSRDKRANLNDLSNRQLVAVRRRNILPHSRYRRRILKEESNTEPRELINMSDDDIFGALPQSFNGELGRYKRVRRSMKKK